MQHWIGSRPLLHTRKNRIRCLRLWFPHRSVAYGRHCHRCRYSAVHIPRRATFARCYRRRTNPAPCCRRSCWRSWNLKMRRTKKMKMSWNSMMMTSLNCWRYQGPPKNSVAPGVAASFQDHPMSGTTPRRAPRRGTHQRRCGRRSRGRTYRSRCYHTLALY